MSITVKLFHGQQDGMELPAIEAPNVVWVPTIETERELKSLRDQGLPISDELLAATAELPYVKTGVTLTESGDEIYRYEYNDDILTYSQSHDEHVVED